VGAPEGTATAQDHELPADAPDSLDPNPATPELSAESIPVSADAPAADAAALSMDPPEPVALAIEAPATLADHAAEPVAAPAAADGVEAVSDVPPVQSDSATPLAEPEFIEVWRPGRPSGPRRPRDGEKRGPHRRRRTPTEAVAQAAAVPAENAALPADGASPTVEADGRGPRRRRRPERGEGSEHGRTARTDDRPRRGRPDRERRPEASERSARDDRPRFGKGRRDGKRDDRRDDRGEGRTWRDPKDRRSGPDPNSPFAKLAALKEQLEADAKERP
jgi:ATP-dependent RNA helicase SUPV3L1/SUV3